VISIGDINGNRKWSCRYGEMSRSWGESIIKYKNIDENTDILITAISNANNGYFNKIIFSS
jgi:hypothetical protein